jgi:hypothetical protein
VFVSSGINCSRGYAGFVVSNSVVSLRIVILLGAYVLVVGKGRLPDMDAMWST